MHTVENPGEKPKLIFLPKVLGESVNGFRKKLLFWVSGFIALFVNKLFKN
jgi:hypothetical protein